MTVQTTAPPLPKPPTRPAQQPSSALTMKMPSVQKIGARLVFVAVEGYGKTSCGAFGPSPVVMMAPGEGGYMTLLSRGLVPTVPIIQPSNWTDTLDALSELAKNHGDRETLVVDALVGFESLCARHICDSEFSGDWGERGFAAFGRGLKIVYRTWPLIIGRLEQCARAGLNVMVLSHAQVKPYRNPDGPDYDRFEANVGPEAWQRLKAWADFVAFGSFRSIVDEARAQSNIAKAKGKAIGQSRVLRCQYSAVADAKNQYGLDPEYLMPDDPAQFAERYWNMVTNNKGAKA